jgi:hypothetical protein
MQAVEHEWFCVVILNFFKAIGAYVLPGLKILYKIPDVSHEATFGTINISTNFSIRGVADGNSADAQK